MLHKLKMIFSSCVTLNEADHINKHNYDWFLTDDTTIIGIEKAELTEKETQLLSTLLTPYSINFPVMTDHEQQWKDWLDGNHNIKRPTNDCYRFIYFTFPADGLDPSEFKEAIQSISTTMTAILWKDTHTGIIIEEGDATFSYEQISDTLMGDLYVKIHFFVGPYQTDMQVAQSYYKQLTHDAPIAFQYETKPVISYMIAMPYLLLGQINAAALRNLPTMVLQETITEPELLRTVDAFIQHDLNVSVTAKALYMHRNSLQYRIDKFIEKTGIDIRQFQMAMAVKLSLFIHQHID